MVSASERRVPGLLAGSGTWPLIDPLHDSSLRRCVGHDHSGRRSQRPPHRGHRQCAQLEAIHTVGTASSTTQPRRDDDDPGADLHGTVSATAGRNRTGSGIDTAAFQRSPAVRVPGRPSATGGTRPGRRRTVRPPRDGHRQRGQLAGFCGGDRRARRQHEPDAYFVDALRRLGVASAVITRVVASEHAAGIAGAGSRCAPPAPIIWATR